MVGFEQAWETPSFWRDLCPELSVSLDACVFNDVLFPVNEEELRREVRFLKQDGYGHLPGVIPPDEVSRMALAVQRAADVTGFPVFALLYDEFWQVLARLSCVVEELLGEEFSVLPDIWAWQLQPTGEDAGWKPHRDRRCGTVLPDGAPRCLSLWLPLTDATPLNGCIYVLPASLDARYHSYGKPGEEATVSYQDIRAVPAKAGAVLFWSSQLLHWGGRSSERAVQPRMSVAFEVQVQSLKPLAKPLLPVHEVPAFEVRLALVARQLLQYQHMVDVPPALSQQCRKWMQALPGKRSFFSVLKNLGSS